MSAAGLLPSPTAMRRLAPCLVLLAAVLFLFRDTAQAMVAIWIRSGTFTHAFLVPPIALWLIWRRRNLLATLQPHSAPWVLLPMAAVCLLWALGELASMNSATQLALVTLMVLAVPAVFGLAVAAQLTFPLLFLYFSVPFGEFMVPYMMEWTADFTVASLQAIGVPVFREGLQFIIPSGSWSVVEACSGVRYLIASFMVGTLFAYLNYRSAKRRAIFMIVSLLIPVVANWLRALMIVLIGHLSSNKLAVGVDHIIYGWLFFGLVIGAMFMIGARWAEPEDPLLASAPAVADTAVQQEAKPASDTTAWLVGAAAVLMLLGTQLWVDQLSKPLGGPPPAVELRAEQIGAWAASTEPLSAWKPNYANASQNVARSYAAQGAKVGVWVAYYRDQDYDRKLVSSVNSFVDIEKPEIGWSEISRQSVAARVSAGEQKFRAATLRGAAVPGVSAAQKLRVWQLYWVGGKLTASDAQAKLYLAVNRMLGRGDDSAALFFYAVEDESNQAAAEADAVLGAFVTGHLEPLIARLEAARRSR